MFLKYILVCQRDGLKLGRRGGRPNYLDASVKQHAVVARKSSFMLAQVAQKRAMLQVFGDDKNRPVFGAHTVQLHQICMLQLPTKKKIRFIILKKCYVMFFLLRKWVTYFQLTS